MKDITNNHESWGFSLRYLSTNRTSGLMTASELPFILDSGCGLDVHKDKVVASIKGKDVFSDTKTFLTFTDNLHALVGWLQQHGITHIAMESTGVY